MKQKINIGLFIDTYFPMIDGVVNVVDNYAKELSKFANVIVFAPIVDKNYDDSKLPYKVIRCKSISTKFLDYKIPMPNLDKKFIKELYNQKLDIVHIHSPFAIGKIGVKYSKKYNIPCIGTMHSQFKLDIKKKIKNKFITEKLLKQIINIFNQCDECWAVNNAVARIFYEEYNYKTLPKIMNNATDLLPIKDCRYINKKYNLKRNEKIFLFIGRINTLKNVLFIADCIKALKTKEPKLKFKMLFVGSGEDEEKLKKYIHKLKLDNDIIMCERESNREILAMYYKRADLFLFPSVYDSSSLVQIEAASQSTPTIFLKNTATASTVTDKVDGYIADYSIEAYSNKILEAINDKNYKKICNNAYNNLYKTWDDLIIEVYNLYLNIIKNKSQNKF